ncbi:hypothetical protein ABB34_05145 [Stenotrophomonas daejeonensis]|uniref:HTH cro/C1-type domain-containing protein n=1 Tax=Stenotrophomonas daejeonensis TaxID=659018 RepID=A0A0R0EAK5_9GAMM|nr:hypothetical protein [Stenotrophomonas daejeonensis]KRG87294.1 hypothetical protein ABB34_05145 [Stenotrophomonas daejeonensis]
MDEKQQFSERLKAAMAVAGLEARPAVLEKLFNLHYRGTPVTYQGVRRWLTGLSLPEQDKLELLADLLGTDADVLRYGNKKRGQVAERKAGWTETTNIDDRLAIELFLRLPQRSRQAVRQVIQALADKLP